MPCVGQDTTHVPTSDAALTRNQGLLGGEGALLGAQAADGRAVDALVVGIW